MTINAPQAAARIRQALRPIDDDGQSHGGPDGWSPTSEQIQEWEDSFREAASPEALRAILDRMDELAKDAATLREALSELKTAVNVKAACLTSNQTVSRIAIADDRLWRAVDKADAALTPKD